MLYQPNVAESIEIMISPFKVDISLVDIDYYTDCLEHNLGTVLINAYHQFVFFFDSWSKYFYWHICLIIWVEVKLIYAFSIWVKIFKQRYMYKCNNLIGQNEFVHGSYIRNNFKLFLKPVCLKITTL